MNLEPSKICLSLLKLWYNKTNNEKKEECAWSNITALSGCGSRTKSRPLSVELIKEIHKVLTSGTYDERRYITNEERPGEFKKHDYVTGVHEVGSAAENVENDLRELIAEVNAYESKDVLKAATYLHARFEFIHPFADGNGRVGRTFMNYYLMIHNHPPLIVYDEDKRMYYDCLQKYDEAGGLNPLYEFFKYETEKT